MATKDPENRFHQGFRKRVFFKGQPGIFGARRIKPAGGGEKRGNEPLVKTDPVLHINQSFILFSILQASAI